MNMKQSWPLLLAIAIFIGTLFTLQVYAPPGTNNQAEDLPRILRAIDNGFLVYDHYVNSSVGSFSIRSYYDAVIVFVVQTLGLHTGLFVLTLLINIATVYLTGYFVYDFFERNLLAALISTVMLTHLIIQVAGSYAALTDAILANFINMVLIYVAFDNVLIKKRLYRGAFVLGLSALIQPVNSIVAYALMSFGVVCRDVFSNMHAWRKTLFKLSLWKQYVIATAIFGALLAMILVPYMLQSANVLTDREFTEIFGYFRIPHHAVPTEFLDINQIIQLIHFIVVIIGILMTLDLVRIKEYRLFFAGGATMLALLFVGNFVFVEIIPTRLFTILVPVMKGFALINWLAVVLVSGYICQKKTNILVLLILYLYLFQYTSIQYAGTILSFQLILWVNQRAQMPKMIKNLSFAVLFGFAIVIIFFIQIDEGSIQFDNRLSNWQTRVTSNAPSPPDLVAFITENTESDDVLLIPPHMFNLRLATSRPLVVTFKTYPANDQGLSEWFERMRDVLTCVDGEVQGFTSKQRGFSVTDAYASLDNACLVWIAKKYDVSYAVVYTSSPITLPAVYSGDVFKIIKFSP